MLSHNVWIIYAERVLAWRGYLVRRKFSDANWNVKWNKLAKLKAVIILQTYVRAWRVRALYDKLKCLHSHQENQQLYFMIQVKHFLNKTFFLNKNSHQSSWVDKPDLIQKHCRNFSDFNWIKTTASSIIRVG